MTTEERTDALTEAQDLIFQAIELIEGAVKGTDNEDRVRRQLLAHLRIAASAEHGYLSRDQNLTDVIAMIRGDDEQADEDE